MTDQKKTQDQPTEISDDDLDSVQGAGTIGNSISTGIAQIPGNFWMGSESGETGVADEDEPEFPVAVFGAGGGGSAI